MAANGKRACLARTTRHLGTLDLANREQQLHPATRTHSFILVMQPHVRQYKTNGHSLSMGRGPPRSTPLVENHTRLQS